MEPKKFTLIKPGSAMDLFLSKRFDSNLFTYRKIFSMLFPIILDQFFISVMQVLSTAMISSSSQESVTAMSLVSPVTGLVMVLSNALAAGGTVIVAQYKGKNDVEKTKEAAGQVIFGSVLVATVASLLLISFSTPVIRMLFGSAEELVKIKARDYLVGMCISVIPYSAYSAGFSVLRGIGETKLCLRLTIFINATYLLLNLLFINVLQLDIVGTALAMIIARLLGGAVALYTVMRKHSPMRIRLHHIMKVRRSMLESIMKVGIPYGFEQVCFNAGGILVQMYMAGLGTVSVAAYAVTNTVLYLLYSAAVSAGSLAITVCGQCIGAGDKALARHYGKQMVLLSTVLILLAIAIFYPLMPYILIMYQAPENTLSLIYQMLLIGVIPMPFFFPMSNAMSSVLCSAGDVSFSTTVSLITMWVVKVAIGYLVGIVLGYGIIGIYYCVGLEWAVKAVIYGIRFKGDKWLNKKAIQD